MNTYLTAIKDVLIIISPIIAYISYRSNRRTRGEIKNEVERITKEKEVETKQILDKINAELESCKFRKNGTSVSDNRNAHSV